jgi:NAD(P)H-dependent FMN reductase
MSDNSKPTQLLAISGSLRQASSNTTLLQTAQALAPENVTITLYERLGDLPHFNPDDEIDQFEAVVDLRAQVAQADGLIISCPEYAHGVPGSFKNALDWLVGGPEFYEKPVAFFNASDRGVHAQASLREIVKTMSGRIIDEACLTLPFIGKHISQEQLETDPELSALICAVTQRFATFLANHQK